MGVPLYLRRFEGQTYVFGPKGVTIGSGLFIILIFHPISYVFSLALPTAICTGGLQLKKKLVLEIMNLYLWIIFPAKYPSFCNKF